MGRKISIIKRAPTKNIAPFNFLSQSIAAGVPFRIFRISHKIKKAIIGSISIANLYPIPGNVMINSEKLPSFVSAFNSPPCAFIIS
jgi:hypothetical protein